MSAPLFIGDELTAQGFRLAGAEAVVAGEQRPENLFRKAVGGAAELVFVSAEVAAKLPPLLLETALLRAKPLVVIIPDIRGARQPPDLKREMEKALGIEM